MVVCGLVPVPLALVLRLLVMVLRGLALVALVLVVLVLVIRVLALMVRGTTLQLAGRFTSCLCRCCCLLEQGKGWPTACPRCCSCPRTPVGPRCTDGCSMFQSTVHCSFLDPQLNQWVLR